MNVVVLHRIMVLRFQLHLGSDVAWSTSRSLWVCVIVEHVLQRFVVLVWPLACYRWPRLVQVVPTCGQSQVRSPFPTGDATRLLTHIGARPRRFDVFPQISSYAMGG